MPLRRSGFSGALRASTALFVLVTALPALAAPPAGDGSGRGTWPRAPTASATEEASPPRLLLIGLDAVPYGIVADLMAPERGGDALFRGFRGPVPLISTFPSTTSLAFGGILEPFGVPASPGYEARFFDREQNRRRGGGLISYQKLPFPWRSFFDWKIHDVFGKLKQALAPKKASRRAIDRSLDAFFASDERAFFAYSDATDLVAHMQGPPELAETLRYVDDALRRARERHPGEPFHAVVYSDHGISGGEPLRNVRKAVRRAVREAGFEISSHVRHSTDVIFMPFGLVSSLVAYTSPRRRVEVARVLATAEGVDFCVAPGGEGFWWVASAAGDALVHRRRNEGAPAGWAYDPLDADPLELAPIAAELRAEHPEAGGYFTDRQWFEATRRAAYPDPLYRIARGFDLVENEASVICSLEEGFMYGAAITTFGSRISLGRLRWTHGSMLREPSLGFVVSDLPGWDPPGILRFDEALEPFAE